ncbi:hypothetical protein [Candidatus Poriferisodalis sp.]|uniref:hypothetical protein n=1 Tax=Candidatus Poriferisodalis sp. TaxID=3101277 RepID=UPI003B029CA9
MSTVRADAGSNDSTPTPTPPFDPRSREGLAEMYAYAHDLAEFKGANPGNDMVSILLAADDAEGGITVVRTAQPATGPARPPERSLSSFQHGFKHLPVVWDVPPNQEAPR